MHTGRGRDVYPHTVRCSRGKGQGVRRYSAQAPLANISQYEKLRPRADRTGRRHRAWASSIGDAQPSLITSLQDFGQRFPDLLRYSTLPLTGWRKYTNASGNNTWYEGNATWHNRLERAQRERYRCDLDARDVQRERDAWRWPVPANLFGFSGTVADVNGKEALEAARKSGRRVVLGGKPPKKGDTVSDRPSQAGKWCRWSHKSRLWLESSNFQGTCVHPSHPRVRSWNRYVSAATQPITNGKKSHGSSSLNSGRKLWALRQRVVSGVIFRGKLCQQVLQQALNAGPFDSWWPTYHVVGGPAAGCLLGYEQTHVVYVAVSTVP